MVQPAGVREHGLHHSRRHTGDEHRRWDITRDDRTSSDHGVVADRDPLEDRCAGTYPDIAPHDDRRSGDLTSTQMRIERMARADETDARSEHDVVTEFDATDVVEAAALVHEDVPADAEVQAAVAVHRWDQPKSRVHRLTGQVAPGRRNEFLILRGKSVESLGAPNGSADTVGHLARFMCSRVDRPLHRHPGRSYATRQTASPGCPRGNVPFRWPMTPGPLHHRVHYPALPWIWTQPRWRWQSELGCGRNGRAVAGRWISWRRRRA